MIKNTAPTNELSNFGTGGGTNLLRRRMLMQPIRQPVIDWDVVWDYTMGLPKDNGFTKTVIGNSPQAEIQQDGLQITVALGTDYIRYEPTDYPTCNEGIWEIELSFAELPVNSGVRMCLSDGEKGCQIFIRSISGDGQYAVLYNAENIQTQILRVDPNVQYILRIERRNGYNTVYLNDAPIYESDIESRAYTIGNRLFFQDSPIDATLKSMKFKKIS